ncbi:MAG: Na(+)/H(+) antiporter subunit B [Gammaproteobacteria bacterium]
MSHYLIPRIVAKFLIPLILIFGFYVQFHGELSPGGGFQAGVIIGSAFILHALIFGLKLTLPIAPLGLLRALSACGVLCYGGVGLASMLMGGNFLDYGALAADPVHGQHLGIAIIEFGVLLTVSSVMILLFFTFTARQPVDNQ